MSGVNRFPMPVRVHSQLSTGAYETRFVDVVLASDYDALAQRCAELERSDRLLAQTQRQVETLSEWHANALNELCDVSKERDQLLAEVEDLKLQVQAARGTSLSSVQVADRLIYERDVLVAERDDARAEAEALRDAAKFASVVMRVVAENGSLTEVERRSLLCEVRRCDAALAAKEGA